MFFAVKSTHNVFKKIINYLLAFGETELKIICNPGIEKKIICNSGIEITF